MVTMRLRTWCSLVSGAGVVGLFLRPESREHTRRTAARVAGGTMTAVGRPADQFLMQARTRLLAALPIAADTKWRIAESLFRKLVVEFVRSDPASSAAVLHEVGRRIAQETDPDEAWNVLTLAEAIQRLTQTLDMEGITRRGHAEVTLHTSTCPLIATAGGAEMPGICDAVCGEGSSLFAGLASGAGSAFSSPQRMGDGDTKCLRVFSQSSMQADASS